MTQINCQKFLNKMFGPGLARKLLHVGQLYPPEWWCSTVVFHKIREWPGSRTATPGITKYKRIFLFTSWVHQVGVGKNRIYFIYPAKIITLFFYSHTFRFESSHVCDVFKDLFLHHLLKDCLIHIYLLTILYLLKEL